MKNLYAIVAGTMLLSATSDMVALTYAYIDNKTGSMITAYEGNNTISIPAGKTVKVGSIERIPKQKASITISTNVFTFLVYTAEKKTTFVGMSSNERGPICWQIKDKSGNIILESENMSMFPNGSKGCPGDRSTSSGRYLIRGECKGLDIVRDPDIYFTISE